MNDLMCSRGEKHSDGMINPPWWADRKRWWKRLIVEADLGEDDVAKAGQL